MHIHMYTHIVTYNFNLGSGNSLLCLSCVCEWDGWGRDGWDGFCFLPFGYGVETFFCLNIFGHQILTL